MSLVIQKLNGLPTFLQNQKKEVLSHKAAVNIGKDCFDSAIIELPNTFKYMSVRNGNLVAVLHLDRVEQKLHGLSLWSLITKCKLWQYDIARDYSASESQECLLSETGMVLVKDTNAYKIVVEGKLSGILPFKSFDQGVDIIGNRILCSWMQRKTTFSPILFENFDFYFGEWDHKGKFIYRHLLFNTPETWHCPAAYDENFWVRIGGRHASMLPSIVEVVDRVLQSMKTFELPLSTEEVVFSKAHISKNQLFFAKNKIDHATGLRRNPTICIFDLIGGVLLHEFPCRDNGGSPECLVANRHYVAWIEQTRILQVKYLDLATKLVEVEFTLTHLSFVQIQLNLSEIFLTATYLLRHGGINRAVIDLRNGNLQYNVMYNASIRDDFSFSNGNLLIAVRDRGLYIESFLGDGQQREGEYRAM